MGFCRPWRGSSARSSQLWRSCFCQRRMGLQTSLSRNQVTAKGKGKKRAAETGEHLLTYGGTLQQPHSNRFHCCSQYYSIPDLKAGDCGIFCLALPTYRMHNLYVAP